MRGKAISLYLLPAKSPYYAVGGKMKQEKEIIEEIIQLLKDTRKSSAITNIWLFILALPILFVFLILFLMILK